VGGISEQQHADGQHDPTDPGAPSEERPLAEQVEQSHRHQHDAEGRGSGDQNAECMLPRVGCQVIEDPVSRDRRDAAHSHRCQRDEEPVRTADEMVVQSQVQRRVVDPQVPEEARDVHPAEVKEQAGEDGGRAEQGTGGREQPRERADEPVGARLPARGLSGPVR
jgi:hypothetical protein